MADEAKIKANGVLLPTPSDISVEIQDLDGDSVRPIATGVLRRNRIRSNMLKVTLTWNLKTFVDVVSILNAVTPTEFNVELYIPDHGIRGTKKMYAGNKKYNYIRTKTGLKVQSFSFALIEVQKMFIKYGDLDVTHRLTEYKSSISFANG